MVMMKTLKTKGFIKETKNYKSTMISIAKLYVSIFEELVIRDMSDDKYESYIEDLSNFIYYGNLGVLGKIKLEMLDFKEGTL